MYKKNLNQELIMSSSNLQEQLRLRKMQLEQALDRINEAKCDEPEGKLRVSRAKGNSQYYQVLSSADTVGKYIRKKDRYLASLLAQKSYNAKLYKSLNAEMEAVNALLNQLNEAPEMIYDNLITERKNIVTPIMMSDEIFSALWLAEEYEKDPYYPEELIYETQRGEFVRSKSEMFIADAYFNLGIPYRYEARLNLKNGGFKYPDFTVLNVKKRMVVYHEHLGKLDDENYRNRNMQKMRQYQESGIYTGKNLIITFEAETVPFNIRQIEKMIKEVLEV